MGGKSPAFGSMPKLRITHTTMCVCEFLFFFFKKQKNKRVQKETSCGAVPFRPGWTLLEELFSTPTRPVLPQGF